MGNNNVIDAAADAETSVVMGVSVGAVAHTTAQSKVNSATAGLGDPACSKGY